MDEKNHYDTIYVINADKWKRFQEVKSFFMEYADRHYGSVSEVETPPATVDATFTVKVDSVDFYNELLDRFTDIVTQLDTISFQNSGEDSVLIKVSVKDMWEVVTPNE